MIKKKLETKNKPMEGDASPSKKFSPGKYRYLYHHQKEDNKPKSKPMSSHQTSPSPTSKSSPLKKLIHLPPYSVHHPFLHSPLQSYHHLLLHHHPSTSVKSPRSSLLGSLEEELLHTQKKTLEHKKKYHTEENVCRVNLDILEKKNLQSQCLKHLKVLQKFKKVGGKNVEYPTNFPQAQRVLTVVRVSSSTQ